MHVYNIYTGNALMLELKCICMCQRALLDALQSVTVSVSLAAV